MYFLKCRRVKETENITTAMSKNGRLMRRGQCITCRKKKTQFLKKMSCWWKFSQYFGEQTPFEMHSPGHNYTGTGTNLYKRLNPDGTLKEWSIPINRVDSAANHHDLCYSKHDDTKTREEICDNTMLGELNGIVNPTLRERIDKSVVGKLINAKVNFGLGAPIKAKTNPTIYSRTC